MQGRAGGGCGSGMGTSPEMRRGEGAPGLDAAAAAASCCLAAARACPARLPSAALAAAGSRPRRRVCPLTVVAVGRLRLLVAQGEGPMVLLLVWLLGWLLRWLLLLAAVVVRHWVAAQQQLWRATGAAHGAEAAPVGWCDCGAAGVKDDVLWWRWWWRRQRAQRLGGGRCLIWGLGAGGGRRCDPGGGTDGGGA